MWRFANDDQTVEMFGKLFLVSSNILNILQLVQQAISLRRRAIEEPADGAYLSAKDSGEK